MSKNYILAYYQAIKNGSVTVGRWITTLYDKIIQGLEQKSFFYDQKAANDAVEWIEAHVFHCEGALAPGTLKLELWQKAIVSLIYGIKDADGHRQFKECLLVVSRKQGKSLFAAGLAKYEWQQNGGYGARVYCVAPKLAQADIIYNNVWNMTRLDPEWQQLKEEIEASKNQHNKHMKDDEMLARHTMTDLRIPGTNSTMQKIALDSKKSDGFNPSMVICDEIASWEGDKGLKAYEVLKSGMGARPDGYILSCTTSGYVNDSIFDELMKRSTRYLLGESKETRLLPILYMIDDIEKWNDINELQKSNPNLGVSVSASYLIEEIAVAEGSLSKKAEFIVKYCNLKQNSSLAWLDAQTVEKAFGKPFELDDFRGCYCVGGIDLSQTTDLTACCIVVEKNGELYVIAKFFLPDGKIEEATERDGIPYWQYIHRGILQRSGENFVNYRDCFDWFRMLVEEYEILPLKVGYDRFSAQYLVQDMETYGFHMSSVFQGDNLWPVIQETEGLLKDGRIHCGDNDLLKIHMLDAAVKMSVERGRGKLIKLSPNAHVDGVAALLDALTVRQKYYYEIGEQLQNGTV